MQKKQGLTGIMVNKIKPLPVLRKDKKSMMKRKSKLFILILASIFTISFATKSEAATKVVTFKTSTAYKILKGEKLRLYVKGHKNNKNIKWKSSNKKIANVSQKGVVTGKRGGTCKITAKIKKKKYTVKIIVFAGENIVYEHDYDPKPPTDRYDTDIAGLNESKKSLFIGQTFTLKVKGTKRKITWKSSNPNVAGVSGKGKISAKNEGKTTITASYEDSEYIYSLECNITVHPLWMTGKKLEKLGLSFIPMSDSSICIGGQRKKDSLTGIVESYLLEIPENLQTDIIYGNKLRFKWNGSELLYNTSDMQTLGLIVEL